LKCVYSWQSVGDNILRVADCNIARVRGNSDIGNVDWLASAITSMSTTRRARHRVWNRGEVNPALLNAVRGGKFVTVYVSIRSLPCFSKLMALEYVL
jgi:hypothetical protein